MTLPNIVLAPMWAVILSLIGLVLVVAGSDLRKRWLTATGLGCHLLAIGLLALQVYLYRPL